MIHSSIAKSTILAATFAILLSSSANAITSGQMFLQYYAKAQKAMDDNNYTAAEDALLGAITYGKKSSPNESELIRQQINLVDCYEMLSEVQMNTGRRVQAEDSLLKALREAEKRDSPQHGEVKQLRAHLIDLYCKYRELNKAVDLYISWGSKGNIGDAEGVRLTLEEQCRKVKWPELRKAYCLAYLKKTPVNTKLWGEHMRSLIKCLIDMNQNAEACTYIKEYLRSYPYREVKMQEQAIAWEQWIKCLEKMGKPDEAKLVKTDYDSRVVYAAGTARYTNLPAEVNVLDTPEEAARRVPILSIPANTSSPLTTLVSSMISINNSAKESMPAESKSPVKGELSITPADVKAFLGDELKFHYNWNGDKTVTQKWHLEDANGKLIRAREEFNAEIRIGKENRSAKDAVTSEGFDREELSATEYCFRPYEPTDKPIFLVIELFDSAMKEKVATSKAKIEVPKPHFVGVIGPKLDLVKGRSIPITLKAVNVGKESSIEWGGLGNYPPGKSMDPVELDADDVVFKDHTLTQTARMKAVNEADQYMIKCLIRIWGSEFESRDIEVRVRRDPAFGQ